MTSNQSRPCLLQIGNNGTEISYTNFWRTEAAISGYCYLSGNAGAWRLLVPRSLEYAIAEMRTGKYVTVEWSQYIGGAIDIVFEDGSDAPYSITLDRRMADRRLSRPGLCRLDVWTEAGKQLSLACRTIA